MVKEFLFIIKILAWFIFYCFTISFVEDFYRGFTEGLGWKEYTSGFWFGVLFVYFTHKVSERIERMAKK